MSRTNQILLAVATAALAICAFYFLALAPKRDEIATLDADIAAKEAELVQAQQSLATYEAARKSYKRNYATLARLGKAVPADDDVRSLLVQLESVADSTGVSFEKIELGSSLAGDTGSSSEDTATNAEGLAGAPGTVPVAGGVLSALPFNFGFSGQFFDLTTFFAKLEHFVSLQNERLDATGRLLRLETISVTQASTGFPTMLAQIGAAAYVVPPVEAVEAPGASVPGAQQASSPGDDSPSTTTTAKAGAAQ